MEEMLQKKLQLMNKAINQLREKKYIKIKIMQKLQKKNS